MRVVIVGAGVVGLTTAYALQNAGHEAVVVEAAAGVGRGASFGNGAQLSYGYVAPLAGPAIWRELPQILFATRGGVRFRFRPERAQWKWCAAFLAACTSRRAVDSTMRLLALAADSRSALHRVLATTPLRFSHRRAGKLVVYRTARAFRAARSTLERLARHAPPQRPLTAEECISIEPLLERVRPHIAGAIYTPDDECGDSHELCTALAQHVSVILNFPVDAIELRGGRAVAVIGPTGRIEGDAVVLANGLGVRALAATVGLSLPIHPLYGYSLTVRAPPCGVPSNSITDVGRRLVLAPLGDRLRLAGFVDVGGRSEVFGTARCAQLAHAAADLLGCELRVNELSPWSGARPATPHGLPVVGATAVPGLFLNAGHGPSGFTLAMGCAELVCRAVEGGSTGFE